MLVFLGTAVCATNFWVLKGSGLLWIGASAGFFLAICLPAWMLSQKIDWRTDQPGERLCYGVVLAILALMVIGLTINTALPHLGISRPLDRGPVLASVDAWCGALALWRPTRFNPTIPRPRWERLKGWDWLVGLLSALCVPMSVVGAVRLNNGAGSGVTLTMLGLAALMFIVMFGKRNQLNPGTLTTAIYAIGLAMLLMTSLRGWYTTGHDIQEEYKVFELTKSHGDWDIARYRDAYNACLSITILPTMLWQLIRVDDPYIYKFWFQLLFALCPVFVYRITLRHTNNALAIITTIYFLAFPTYFTDMPFLNRQEIAFLFVGACVLLASSPSQPRRMTRLRIGIFSVGVVLSHYSTAYVFLGTLAIGWVGYRAWLVLARFRQRTGNARRYAPSARMSSAISFVNVAVVLVGIILWNGVATQTTTGLSDTVAQTVLSLRGGTSTSNKSADVSYSLFSMGTPSQSQLVNEYASASLTQTAAERAAGAYYPVKVINRYPVKIVPLPSLTVTKLGQYVNDIGVSVATLNSDVRAGAARLLQLFVAVGLIAAALSRKRRSRSFIELISLGFGALIIVALQVVLPVISVDYGVLRAFLQALIVFGPFVAIGSVTLFKFLREKWCLRAAFALAVLFFLSLSGVIPQLLGGYPAQLNLNNSGQYYDIYYLHPQEVSAIEWLQTHGSANSHGDIQSELEIDPYTYNLVQTFTGLSAVNDIFPTLLRKNAYIFLGYTTVVKDQATFSDDGDLITYRYPLGLLNSTDDLLYSSNGARVYR